MKFYFGVEKLMKYMHCFGVGLCFFFVFNNVCFLGTFKIPHIHQLVKLPGILINFLKLASKLLEYKTLHRVTLFLHHPVDGLSRTR